MPKRGPTRNLDSVDDNMLPNWGEKWTLAKDSLGPSGGSEIEVTLQAASGSSSSTRMAVSQSNGPRNTHHFEVEREIRRPTSALATLNTSTHPTASGRRGGYSQDPHWRPKISGAGHTHNFETQYGRPRSSTSSSSNQSSLPARRHGRSGSTTPTWPGPDNAIPQPGWVRPNRSNSNSNFGPLPTGSGYGNIPSETQPSFGSRQTSAINEPATYQPHSMALANHDEHTYASRSHWAHPSFLHTEQRQSRQASSTLRSDAWLDPSIQNSGHYSESSLSRHARLGMGSQYTDGGSTSHNWGSGMPNASGNSERMNQYSPYPQHSVDEDGNPLDLRSLPEDEWR